MSDSNQYMAEGRYKTCDMLRCGLVVLIVLIHTRLSEDVVCSDTLYPAFLRWADNVLWLANPLFFVMSGYLFFKADNWSLKQYKAKLVRRVRTWLIPYLCWNTAYLLLYLVGFALIPTLMGHVGQSFQEISFIDCVTAYTGWSSGWQDLGPIDGPLWFLRDLILLALIAPLIYAVLNASRYSVLLLVGLYLCEVPFFNVGSLVFFCLGAYASIWHVSLLHQETNSAVVALLIFVALAVIYTSCDRLPWVMHSYVGLGKTMAGMWALICIASKVTQHLDSIRLSRASDGIFFIFAMHAAIARLLTKLSAMYLISIKLNVAVLIAVQIVNTIATILFCFFIYRLLRRYTPQLASMLGAR